VTTGSVAASAGLNVNKSTPGVIVISVFGPTPFAGAAELLNIHMRVVGEIGQSSALTLMSFSYNAATVCSNVTNGNLAIRSGVVSGRVTYENAVPFAVPVPNTTINATGGSPVSNATDVNGNYNLSGFGTGPYTVTPGKADMSFNAPNGIFSNDAALISQHVVGLITLTPAQLKAASVSGLPTISSLDAGLLAQWIVGIPNVINQTGKWKFTPSSRSYPGMNNDLPTENYEAILMGDVNGDWISTLMRSQQSTPLFGSAITAGLPNVEIAAGTTELILPFSLDGLEGVGVSSYQFVVEYDPAVLTPTPAAADPAGTLSEGLTVISNTTQPGILRVAVYGVQPVSGDGVYLNLKFRASPQNVGAYPIMIREFRLNDGSTTPVTRGGRVTFADPTRRVITDR